LVAVPFDTEHCSMVIALQTYRGLGQLKPAKCYFEQIEVLQKQLTLAQFSME
jgi:hypothetical protein